MGDLIIPSTAKRPKKWGNLEGTVEPSKLTVESTFTFLPSHSATPRVKLEYNSTLPSKPPELKLNPQ